MRQTRAVWCGRNAAPCGTGGGVYMAAYYYINLWPRDATHTHTVPGPGTVDGLSLITPACNGASPKGTRHLAIQTSLPFSARRHQPGHAIVAREVNTGVRACGRCHRRPRTAGFSFWHCGVPNLPLSTVQKAPKSRQNMHEVWYEPTHNCIRVRARESGSLPLKSAAALI